MPPFCEATKKVFGYFEWKAVAKGTKRIVVGLDHQRLMCKKCARKIVNWLRFFNGLQQVFTARFLLEKYRRKFQTHNRLPTLTASKGQLEYSMLQPRPSWKRTLFGKNPVVEYTVVNEEISHLMKIPTKKNFFNTSCEGEKQSLGAVRSK